MSKSLGNFVDLKEIDEYVATFSLDALRFFLAAEGPLGTNDSDFAKSKFIEVYNSQLANTLGNSLSRNTNMTGKYFDGKVPEAKADAGDATLTAGVVAELTATSVKAYEQLDLAGAINAAMGIVRKVDEFIDRTKPFTLAKDPANKERVATILYNCLEAIRVASGLLWPVMPVKMEALWGRLGLDYAGRLKAQSAGSLLAELTVWGQLKPGTVLTVSEPLFPRFVPAKEGGK